MRLYPHRVADEDAVIFQPWWYLEGDQEVQLPTHLEGWDYRTVLEVGLDFEIDWLLFTESTGIRDQSSIEMLLLADCRDSQYRIAQKIDISEVPGGETYSGSIALPAGRLAGSVDLSAHLVLANDAQPDDVFTAAQAGSRLLSSPVYKVVLEGGGSRFPVEPVSFRDTNRPNIPWQLSANTADPNASFMGSVRLFVNTDHASGRMLLDPGSVDRVKDLVMADLIRLLIAQLVAESDQDVDRQREFEELEDSREVEGSIAHVMDEICGFYLKMTLPQALSLYWTRPIAFDEMLHERLDPTARLFA